jgi:hypothetical protein
MPAADEPLSTGFPDADHRSADWKVTMPSQPQGTLSPPTP